MDGQTFGTQLWTKRFGELVGEDEQGNRYYRTKGGKIDPTLGFERRWVVYNGYAEAGDAAVLAWLDASHRGQPPTKIITRRASGKSRTIPISTGTPNAYRPSGSTLAAATGQGDRRLSALDAELGLRTRLNPCRGGDAPASASLCCGQREQRG